MAVEALTLVEECGSMMMTPTIWDTSLKVLGPQTRTPHTPQIPPEDNNPKGCSLHSMEPLREWFCKGADMTSPAEYEASLCQLEDDPPDIRQYNANIREERWAHFSLGGCKVPHNHGGCDSERRSTCYLRERSYYSLSADIASRSSVHSCPARWSQKDSRNLPES